MKKRLLLLLLCAALLVFAFSACRKNPKEDFENLVDKFAALEEISFTTSVNLDMSTSLFTSEDSTNTDLYGDDTTLYTDTDDDSLSSQEMYDLFGEKVTVVFDVAGTASKANEQLTASANMELTGDKPENNISTKITDVIVDGDVAYVNFATIFDLMMKLEGIDGIKYSDYFPSDYVYYTLGTGGSLWNAEGVSAVETGGKIVKLTAGTDDSTTGGAESSESQIAEKIKNIVDAKLTQSAYSSGKNEASLTVDKALLLEIISALLEDMNTNRDLYIDAYIDMVWNSTKETLEMYGATQEEMDQAYQELEATKDQLRLLIPVLKTMYEEMDKETIPDFLFKMTVKEMSQSEYGVDVELKFGDMFNMSMESVSQQTEVAKVTVPENAIPYEAMSGLM